MSQGKAVPPSVIWAQSKSHLFVTLQVESKDSEIKFTEDSLHFKGTGLPENKLHEVTINFLNKVDKEKVTSKNISRCIEFVIPKADTSLSYWSTLTNDAKKPHWLKVDFNKWKDEGSDDEMGGGAGDDEFNMDDIVKKVGNLGDGRGPKPSFDDLEEDDVNDEDSDDDLPDEKFA